MQKGDGGRELCIWCLFNVISQEDCLFFINLRKRPSGSQQIQFDLKTGTGNHGKCFYSSVFNQNLGHFFLLTFSPLHQSFQYFIGLFHLEKIYGVPGRLGAAVWMSSLL